MPSVPLQLQPRLPSCAAPRLHTPKRASGPLPPGVRRRGHRRALLPRCWKAGSRLHKARSRDWPGFSLSFRPGLDQGKDEFAAIRKRFKIEKALTRPIPTLCAPAVGFLCVPGPARPTRSTQLRALARVPFCAVFSLGGLSGSLSMSHMVFVFNFLFRGLQGSEKDGFCRNSLPCAGTMPQKHVPLGLGDDATSVSKRNTQLEALPPGRWQLWGLPVLLPNGICPSATPNFALPFQLVARFCRWISGSCGLCAGP